MFEPALASIKERITLSLNDTYRYEGTILSYAGVVNYLLRRYENDAVIAKNDEEIQKFKKSRERRAIYHESYGTWT